MPASDAGRPVRRVRAAFLAIGAFGMVAAFSYLRGFDATLPPGGYLYSQLTYEDGFIRRGLLGSLISFVRGGSPTDDIAGLILGVHLLASLLIVLVLGLWLGYLILTVADRAGTWLLVAVSGLFVSSQFLPTLGFLGGFVDGAAIAVLVAAAALVASGRLVTGSLVAAAGPMLHETFLALWVPVAVAGVALWVAEGHRERLRAGWLVAPLVTTAVVLALHDESALASQVRSIVPDDASATWIIDSQFHQSAVESVRATLERLPTSWDVDLWALVVFTLPALVTVALVALAYRSRLGRWDAIALVAAVVSPMAILLVATDISRFLVIVNLVTFTVVLMLLSRSRVGSPLPRTVLAGVGLLCVVGLLMPLVYVDIDAGDVFENGLLRIWGAPQSRP